MRSLRRELLLWLAIGIGTAILLAGGLLVALFRARSTADFDARLAAKAGAIATLLRRTATDVELDFADELMPEFHRPSEPEYFQLWVDGSMFERSLSLGTRDLPRRTGEAHAPAQFDLPLPDGRRGRATGLAFAVDAADGVRPDAGAPVIRAELVLAASREGLDQSERRVLQALLLAGAVLAVATWIAVQVAVRRCTRTIGALTKRVGAIDPRSPHPALAPGDVPSELAPLASTLGATLERLRQALERERRVTSNVAHELRTPVAELKTAVDVAQRWPDDPELAVQAIHAASRVSLRMSAAIEALLRLGRLDAGRHPLAADELDVARILTETLAEATPRGSGATRVETRSNGAAVVRGDGALLRLLARNLLQNALDHSTEGSGISSELRCTRRIVRWTLSNAAENLTADDLRSFGEPFWSNPKARSGRDRNGLGLPLARAICRAMRWRLAFRIVGRRLDAVVFMRSVAR